MAVVDCDFAVRMVVFDFDQTLSPFHVFSALGGSCRAQQSNGFAVSEPYAKSELGQMRRIEELDQEPHFAECGGCAFAALGGKERVKQLRGVLSSFRQGGVDLVVCSKGYVGVVRKLLASVGLLELFSEVYGCAGEFYGTCDYDEEAARTTCSAAERAILGASNTSKWETKAELISRVMTEKRLGFCEVIHVDDTASEIKSLRSGAVCRTFWVNGDEGLTAKHCEDIVAMAKEVGDGPAAQASTPKARTPKGGRRGAAAAKFTDRLRADSELSTPPQSPASAPVAETERVLELGENEAPLQLLKGVAEDSPSAIEKETGHPGLHLKIRKGSQQSQSLVRSARWFSCWRSAPA